MALSSLKRAYGNFLKIKDRKKNPNRIPELPWLRFLCLEPEYGSYQIGKFTYGVASPHVSGGDEGKLKIGKFCSVASNVTIILTGEHSYDWITTYPFQVIFPEFQKIKQSKFTKGDVVIGNDVCIGRNVLILSGLTIGDGAVVGAGSVVTKDVEPYAIVASNPARMIKKRFDQATIDELMKIKWWDWPIARIKENMYLLLSDRIQEFIERNKA